VSSEERAAILDMFAKDAPIAPAERAEILAVFEGGPGSSSSTYSGGDAWAADVAARRAAAKAGQLDALRASIASGEVNIDTRPGSIHVQRGDSLSKIAARFPEYGSTNDLKNQLIAANPWLADPNLLQEGMELKFPGAGTTFDSAAMARAAGADARYQATLDVQTAQSQRERWDALQTGAWSGRTDPSGPVWNMRDASADALSS
jgi:phage tail protein X